jgi:hypothetical protein
MTYWTNNLFKSLEVWKMKTFFTLTFMKSKLWNWLAEHLDIAMHMFAKDFFTKETFLF